MPTLTVAAIAELCGGEAEGELGREIRSANALADAAEYELSFVNNRKAAAMAEHSNAGCLLVPLNFLNSNRRTIIRVADPRVAAALVIRVLHPPAPVATGVHPAASIALSAKLAADCSVGANAVIGERAHIGAGSVIGAGCVIQDDVTVGENCLFYPNVTIYAGVRIENRVILHSGCVIGADGFGFAFNGEYYEKFPQIGSVLIEDEVEIGANSCIDRAAFGITRIGQGTKIDNMVHVAHNCDIGKHVVIAAQTGFSGAVKVGDYAVIGGQVGVGDKATIESRAIVGSGSGILTSKIVRAGEPVWGTPARPLRQHLEQLASAAKTPQVLNELKALRERVEKLEKS
jgi:UDP-3-O-[3-hydroxymyristoyl] glucosamine N-acyltransferase